MASFFKSILFCLWLVPPTEAGIPSASPVEPASGKAREESPSPAPARPVAAAPVAAAPVVAAPVMKPGLFGSTEISSHDMSAFTKWTDMWRRHAADAGALGLSGGQAAPQGAQDEEACGREKRLVCSREGWEKLVAASAGLSPAEKLKAVNDYMNRTPYIVDPENWGLPDYWATPKEFFLKDGDCEDYAISKYVTLKRLGLDPAAMRLVIVQDENLRVAHAVLAVSLGEDVYILDNQVDAVLPQQKILHYRPVYSINETGWWLHQRRRARS